VINLASFLYRPDRSERLIIARIIYANFRLPEIRRQTACP
jgi:hypothetical protein